MEQTREISITEQEVRSRVERILADRKITQASLAKQAGISAAALSQWVNQNYTGDNDGMTAKLASWLTALDRAAEASEAMPSGTWFLELGVARKIHATLTYAQAAGDMAIIYGPPGIGKSRAIRQYQNTSPNVWRVDCHPSVKGVSALLDELARVMLIRGRAKKARHVTNEIVRKAQDSRGLIILDEAQHLELAALEEARYLHDATEIGLVLAGNESVYANISGGRRDAAFAQLFSRVGKRLPLGRPSRDDVAALAGDLGVTGEPELAFCLEMAQEPGALRAVYKTLRLAGVMASGLKEETGIKHIQAAWKDITKEEKWKRH